MDISPFFSGGSLRFGVSGDGVVVDPATGVATVSADALLSGVSVSVTAVNSGGQAELGFLLKVVPAAAATPPALTTPPALLGSGRIGEPLAVEPGVWTGDPAPELALQWLRDGAPLAGATGERYVPGAAEDGLSVACRVTARNAAGEAVGETEPLKITQVPPAAVGTLADLVLAQGSGARSVPAAGAFAGAGLRFSVTGAGAEIDPATGVATIPTQTARAAETVAVTAANSGGEARVHFAVTVLAAPAALGTPQPAVFALAAGTRSVETRAFFTGPSLAYALEDAPAGVTINAGSGLVTVPTGAALQATLNVRASNAAGAARQTLAVKVEAVPPQPLAAADVSILRSVWRPLGQSVTFSPVVAFPGLAGETVDAIQWTAAPLFELDANWHPCAARPGEAGAYDLFATGHPLPAGEVDPALFSTTTEANRARLSRLRFRWRETANGPFSVASEAFTAPAPVTPVTAPIPSPGDPAINQALSIGFNRYDVESYASRLGNRKPVKSHGPVVLALAAFAGNTAAYGGKTPAQHTMDHIKFWTNGSSTTDNGNAPAMIGGYPSQYEMMVVCVIALAKLTPAVWNNLTTIEKAKCELLMKGALAANCWIISDRNPYILADQLNQQRDLRGFNAGRTRVPNFRTPAALTPYIVAAHMGVANANAFLANFNRAAFAREIEEMGGLWDMWDTFRKNWPQPNPGPGPGPTATQLQDALKGPNGGNFKYRGYELSDFNAVYAMELATMWGATIQPGYETTAAGSNGYGVFEGSANGGRKAWVGRIGDMTKWAGLPNQGLVGAGLEFDTTDGDGPRSSPTYVFNGYRATVAAALTLAAQGVIDRRNSAVVEAFARMSRGVTDIRYKTANGYRGYSKGGRTNNTSPNEDWNQAYADAQGFSLTSVHGLWDDSLRRWAYS